MRVEVSFVTPDCNSYNATGYTSHVHPHVEMSDVLKCIHKSIDAIVHFKPGMEIEILIKEDWTYES